MASATCRASPRGCRYIAELGVDAIWISPFFKSPMKDFGYDVSDYCDVDPMFGTLADFDALIAKAHGLGLQGHDRPGDLAHVRPAPVVRREPVSRDNPKADWYVWADPKPDGTPPNNWLSVFGGSAWQWDARRMQYYLHNFLASSRTSTSTIRGAGRAARRRRASGSSAASTASASTPSISTSTTRNCADNPADAAEGRATTRPRRRSIHTTMQDHLYDKSRPENIGFLKRFRAVLDDYPATAAVGEVGDSQRGARSDGRLYAPAATRCRCATPSTSWRPRISARAHVRSRARKIRQGSASDGWACWAFSNHDVVRHVSRWGAGETTRRYRQGASRRCCCRCAARSASIRARNWA